MIVDFYWNIPCKCSCNIIFFVLQGLMHSSNDDELKDVKQFIEKILQ